MSKLWELALLCEQVTRPERELDGSIAVMMGINPQYEGDGYYGCPKYTASVDAALTLLPEAFCWKVNSMTGNAKVFRPFGPTILAAATPALALCAGALRAHDYDRSEET